MPLGTKQNAERTARLGRQFQTPQPAIIGALQPEQHRCADSRTQSLLSSPQALPSRCSAAPPISGAVRFPAALRPVHKAHGAAQSRRARESHRPSCADIPPEPAKTAGPRRDRPHRAAPRRATPSANHRPASAHRASFDRWTKPDETKTDGVRPRRLLTSRHVHRPTDPQAPPTQRWSHAASTSLPRRSTPTTTPSMIMGCSLRSTRMGSKSVFSGSSHTIEPSCR